MAKQMRFGESHSHQLNIQNLKSACSFLVNIEQKLKSGIKTNADARLTGLADMPFINKQVIGGW